VSASEGRIQHVVCGSFHFLVQVCLDIIPTHTNIYVNTENESLKKQFERLDMSEVTSSEIMEFLVKIT
jgi:uncharacterized protein YsxB (DUF464 family)